MRLRTCSVHSTAWAVGTFARCSPQTAPVIAHYSGQPTYRAIDGRQSPEQVRQQLIEALASALGCRPNELVTAGRGQA